MNIFKKIYYSIKLAIHERRVQKVKEVNRVNAEIMRYRNHYAKLKAQGIKEFEFPEGNILARNQRNANRKARNKGYTVKNDIWL